MFARLVRCFRRAFFNLRGRRGFFPIAIWRILRHRRLEIFTLNESSGISFGNGTSGTVIFSRRLMLLMASAISCIDLHSMPVLAFSVSNAEPSESSAAITSPSPSAILCPPANMYILLGIVNPPSSLSLQGFSYNVGLLQVDNLHNPH